MAEITLKRERPVLTVNIGDDGEQKRVPLTLNRKDYEDFANAESGADVTHAFFAKYLGDIYDELGDDDLNALLSAWSEARRELGAPDMGKPSASPNS